MLHRFQHFLHHSYTIFLIYHTITTPSKNPSPQKLHRFYTAPTPFLYHFSSFYIISTSLKFPCMQKLYHSYIIFPIPISLLYQKNKYYITSISLWKFHGNQDKSSKFSKKRRAVSRPSHYYTYIISFCTISSAVILTLYISPTHSI